jgi:hypothetical protein
VHANGIKSICEQFAAVNDSNFPDARGGALVLLQLVATLNRRTT